MAPSQGFGKSAAGLTRPTTAVSYWSESMPHSTIWFWICVSLRMFKLVLR
jgi:hypothetical protein